MNATTQMNILITGASGLLGNHLTRLFLSRGHRVRALIEHENAADGLDDQRIEKCICDIRDPAQVSGCAGGMDVIVHAAADTSVWPNRSAKVRDVNIRGTEYLLEEALRSAVRRFIFVSTASAFQWGSGQSPGSESSGKRTFDYHIDYYESKEQAQKMVLKAVREQGLPGIVVNPTFMVGPQDFKMNAARLIRSVQNRKVPGYPPGGRNFIHVQDVALGIYHAIELGKIGECYILGNENLSYRQFFALVGEVSGNRVPVLPIPAFLVRLAGLVQSLIAKVSGSPPALCYHMARGACQQAYYSSEKARKDLRLPATPVSLAIRETIDWLNTLESAPRSHLSGKIVLVTGSTSGLGRELAAKLHMMGARVIINGRDRNRLRETAQELAGSGRQVTVVQGDVARPEDCRKMIDACIREHGRLDILINNAGTGSNGLFRDTVPEATRKVVETNLFGSVYPTYYAMPHVIASKGSIVFISSLAGIHGLPFTYAYSASKMALTALVQSLRIELAGTGVHTGIMYVGFLKNGPHKRIIGSNNELVPATGKPAKYSMSLMQASMQIIKAIERRKVVKVFSPLGRFLYLSNRIWPRMVRKILSRSMKFMKDAYTPMHQLQVPKA